MKTLLILIVITAPLLATGQDLIGKWQLTKQTNCIEDEIGSTNDSEDELIADMKSRSGADIQVLTFKENNLAEENTKIINRRKSYNSKTLMYKFTGTTLHILDKKSRTIIDSFTVEKITGDSLIISNAQRACDTKVFIKIK